MEKRENRKIVVTIEQTGKKWKGMSVISDMLVFLGLLLLLIGTGSSSGTLVVISILMLVCGIPMSIISRIGKWWYHG